MRSQPLPTRAPTLAATLPPAGAVIRTTRVNPLLIAG